MGSDGFFFFAMFDGVKFQFTLPHGERRVVLGCSLSTPTFQFTLPHGERPENKGIIAHPQGFNSRSRMGSDAEAR